MALPRGVINKNPGNLIRNDADKWQGVSKIQSDPKFWVFDDAVYGIRAIGRQLIAYQDRHGCKTIRSAIEKYAPPSDNNPTSVYANNVANHVGCGVDEEVSWHDYKTLRGGIEGIIHQECGAPWQTWYTEAQLVKACVLAGVEPPKRKLIASPQVIGSAIAGTATVAGPMVQTAQEQLAPLTDYSDLLKQAFVIVALLGVVITIIAKLDERKKGIS